MLRRVRASDSAFRFHVAAREAQPHRPKRRASLGQARQDRHAMEKGQVDAQIVERGWCKIPVKGEGWCGKQANWKGFVVAARVAH